MENKTVDRVVFISEFFSAALSEDVSNGNADQIKANATDYIAENYGLDLSECNVDVVENSNSEMHVALPYYDALNEVAAQAIIDEDMNLAAGFEVWAVASLMASHSTSFGIGSITAFVLGTASDVAAAKQDGSSTYNTVDRMLSDVGLSSV